MNLFDDGGRTGETQKWYGVGRVEEYLKHDLPSPCALCVRLSQDKEMCAFTCKLLAEWQVRQGYVSERRKGQIGELVEGNRLTCERDGKRLVYEDGVLYCPQCLQVYFRCEAEDNQGVIDAMLQAGFDPGEVAEVLEVMRGWVLQVAKRNGWEQDPLYYSKEEKAEIVELAVECGTKVAADKFGVCQETVTRYMNEFGCGFQQRYRKLRELAEVMFGNGASDKKVMDRLGVARKTVRKWRKGFSDG